MEIESRFFPGTSLDVRAEKCLMYHLATIPVRMQHMTVPSLTPPRVPNPTIPMTAAMTTMVVSELTRTLP